MILLPISEELRSFTIQVTLALKKLKNGPVRINGHQVQITFHFSRPKIHSLIHFSSFSLTKILLASSEMHEDNV